MRTRALLCRLRKLHNHVLHVEANSSALLARGISSRAAAVAGSSAAARSVNVAGGLLHHARQQNVRMMGVGSFKEGNRAGQHGVKYPQTKADGSPEKQESDAREEFLEKAKASSPSEAQEPIRGTTTELGFGVKDGKNTSEAIQNASEELFKQSSINAKDTGEGPTKEEDKRKYPEHESSFDPEEKEEPRRGPAATAQVDVQGREKESVGGVSSTTDESTGSGETARENIDKTRSEMRDGKARSPQVGVVVGHVASAGANALDNEDNIPDDAVKWERTGEETLDKAQKQYEQAVAGFGTKADKNLKDKPEDTSDTKFHNTS